jgi:dTDP-4-dehydrorhamnose 3,5-epimerase
MALEDDTMISYLCTATYNPGREHGVHPLDPALGIDWPTTGRDGSPLTPLLSAKDSEAPTLAEAQQTGLLPDHAEVHDYLAGLRADALTGRR